MKIFIIGLPRSGTSLLYKMVSSHPEVELHYESDVLYSWPEMLSGKQKGWAEKVDSWNGHLSRRGYSAKELDSFPKLSKKDAMDFLYESIAKPETKVIGEKSALYSSHLKKLRSDFPEARFIVLWRDLVDVFDSVYRAALSGDKYFAQKGLDYEYLGDLERLQKGVEFLHKEGADILELNFADLVREKEVHCKKICEFLEIGFHSNMLSGEDFDNAVIPQGEHHSGVKKGNLDSKEERGKGISEIWGERIARFEKRWQNKYLKTARKSAEASDSEPSLCEFIFCGWMYKLSKLRLNLKVFLFWIIPKCLLDMLRKR